MVQFGLNAVLLVAAACCGSGSDGDKKKPTEGSSSDGNGTKSDGGDKAPTTPEPWKCPTEQADKAPAKQRQLRLYASSSAQSAFASLVREFEDCYGVKVAPEYLDGADLPDRLTELLTGNPATQGESAQVESPDAAALPTTSTVIAWRVDARVKQAMATGKLTPITDIWTDLKLAGAMVAGMRDLVTNNGKQYGIPYTLQHWVIYYRYDLLGDDYQAKPDGPQVTWDQFNELCGYFAEKKNIAPLVISTDSPLSSAVWFSYLNLRINGLAFHRQFVRGEVPYHDDKDKRVANVMSAWSQLLARTGATDTDKCYFKKVNSVRAAEAALHKGEAAMYLFNASLVDQLAQNANVDHAVLLWAEKDSGKYRVLRFPTGIPGSDKNANDLGGEIATTGTLHGIASAGDKENVTDEDDPGRQFLEFVARNRPIASQPAQENVGVSGQLALELELVPPHRSAVVASERTPFLAASAAIFRVDDGPRKVDGVSQQLEFDMRAELYASEQAGKYSMSQALADVMKKPTSWAEILEKLEQRRSEILDANAK